MTALDLTVCPICREEYSLRRQTARREGRTQITYACVECGSVLLWLGDDLWLEADRWAYQKVGCEEKAYLLHRTLTVDELRDLASSEAAEEPGVADAAPRYPADQGYRAKPRYAVDSGDRHDPEREIEAEFWVEAAQAMDAPAWMAGEAATPAEETRFDAPPVGSDGGESTGSSQIRRQRSRGSPFLVISVVLILLCLVCSASVMIVSTNFSGRTPQAVQAVPTETPVPSDTPVPTPTETPLPSDTPVPAPTETLPIAPTEEAAVQFQGVTAYVASTGSHYVVGEVLNTTGDNLRFVEILASFYDGDGQLVGTGSTFSELSIVEPGGIAPFKLATLDPPPSLADYKLRVDYLTTSQDPLRLEVVNHSGSLAESGWYIVSGEVRNPYDFAVKFPEIVATYYNATHQVVRVEVAFSALDVLQAGEVSPFEVVLVDPPADLHHYALQTEAVRE
jgi:hypothetical protein